MGAGEGYGKGASWWFSLVSMRHSVGVNAAVIGNDSVDDSCEEKDVRRLVLQAEIGCIKQRVREVGCWFGRI